MKREREKRKTSTHFLICFQISQLVSDDPNARDIIPILIWVGDIK